MLAALFSIDEPDQCASACARNQVYSWLFTFITDKRLHCLPCWCEKMVMFFSVVCQSKDMKISNLHHIPRRGKNGSEGWTYTLV